MNQTITQVLDKMSHDELIQFAHWYAKELKKQTKTTTKKGEKS